MVKYERQVMINQQYDMLQQNEPKEICEENFCDFNKCFLQTHIAKKNGGERLIQKIDN